MVCKNCGFEAGDSVICPNCGHHMIYPESNENVNEMANQMVNEINNKNVQSMPPKKKKWPLVAGITAIVAVIAIIAGFLAYPAIKNVIAPSTNVAKILKDESSRMKSSMEKNLSDISATGISGVNNAKGFIRLDNVSGNATDYMSYLNVDTLQYDIHTDMLNQKVSGIFGLSKGEDKSVVEVKFYEDKDNIYFNIPALSSQSFKVAMKDVINSTSSKSSIYGTDVEDYADIANYALSHMDKDDIKEYTSLMQKVLPYIFSGIDTLWDNAEYSENGTIKVETKSGMVDASSYKVKVSQNAMFKAIEQIINSIYADTNLTSYTSLLSAVVNVSKDTLIIGIEQALSGLSQTEFEIAVNKDNRIVEISFDFGNLTGYSDNYIKWKLMGSEEPMDYVECEVNLTGDAQSALGKSDLSKYTLGITAVSDRKTNSNATDIKASDFSNAVDVMNMTKAQQNKISQDLLLNMGILKSIFSGEGLSKLMK